MWKLKNLNSEILGKSTSLISLSSFNIQISIETNYFDDTSGILFEKSVNLHICYDQIYQQI